MRGIHTRLRQRNVNVLRQKRQVTAFGDFEHYRTSACIHGEQASGSYEQQERLVGYNTTSNTGGLQRQLHVRATGTTGGKQQLGVSRG